MTSGLHMDASCLYNNSKESPLDTILKRQHGLKTYRNWEHTTIIQRHLNVRCFLSDIIYFWFAKDFIHAKYTTFSLCMSSCSSCRTFSGRLVESLRKRTPDAQFTCLSHIFMQVWQSHSQTIIAPCRDQHFLSPFSPSNTQLHFP